MRFLVTGGCGYIGSQLIRDLSRRYPDATIRVIDNMFRERYVSLWNLDIENFEFIEGDISNEEDVKNAINGIHIVIDLAGITNAPLSFERKELTKKVNYEGAKIVLEQAIRNKVKRLIYSSTASVYGPTNDIITEDYECKPVSPYAKYKLWAEKEIMKAVRQKRINATILRLGTVHGWTIGMRFDTVVDRFVYLACMGLPLMIYESAIREKRPYIHVKDVIRAFLFTLEHEEMNGEIYNVVGQNAGISEVVDVIKKYVPNVKTIITKTPSLNQLSYVLDDSKIRRLGFKTLYTLDDGVREMVEKFTTNKRLER